MVSGEAHQTARVERLHRARPGAPHDKRRRRDALVHLRNVGRRVRLCAFPQEIVERPSAGAGEERGDCHGAQAVDGAVEEQEEEQDACREGDADERHAEARYRVLLYAAE